MLSTSIALPTQLPGPCVSGVRSVLRALSPICQLQKQMLLPRRPLQLCRRHGRTCTVLLAGGAAGVEREAPEGWGELREAAVGEVLPCQCWGQLSLEYTAYLWLECLQETWKSVTRECGLPARGFLSNCLLGYWVLFRAFFFFFPSPCNLGFITGFKQNRTVGVGKTHKLVMMFLWCPVFDVWLNFKASRFHQ